MSKYFGVDYKVDVKPKKLTKEKSFMNKGVDTKLYPHQKTLDLDLDSRWEDNLRDNIVRSFKEYNPKCTKVRVGYNYVCRGYVLKCLCTKADSKKAGLTLCD